MSAQCIIQNRHLSHLSPPHSDSFEIIYEYKNWSLLKGMYIILFLLNFQQVQAILGSNQLVRDGK